MPIIWRYLLTQYLKVLCLCVLTFIAILFVIRLHQLAELAALGAPLSYVLLFALYLIPHILPIALPVSCLISSMLLFQRLSHTHELTAMRACGMGLRHITRPILLAGCTLGVINFYVASELSTYSHLLGHKMQSEVAHVNPLLLLQHEKLTNRNEFYSNMRTMRTGELAEDMTIVMYNPSSKRLNLLCAKEINLHDQKLGGKSVSVITSLDSANENDFDHLVIENQRTMETPAKQFSHLISRASGLRLTNDVLQLRLLLLRIERDKQRLEAFQNKTSPAPATSMPIDQKISRIKRHINQCYSEIFRRFSLGAAVFTFTFMGCVFGIEVGRQRSKRGLITVAALGLLVLSSFTVAKSIDKSLWIPFALYLVPHLIIIPIGIQTLKRITKGGE